MNTKWLSELFKCTKQKSHCNHPSAIIDDSFPGKPHWKERKLGNERIFPYFRSCRSCRFLCSTSWKIYIFIIAKKNLLKHTSFLQSFLRLKTYLAPIYNSSSFSSKINKVSTFCVNIKEANKTAIKSHYVRIDLFNCKLWLFIALAMKLKFNT